MDTEAALKAYSPGSGDLARPLTGPIGLPAPHIAVTDPAYQRPLPGRGSGPPRPAASGGGQVRPCSPLPAPYLCPRRRTHPLRLGGVRISDPPPRATATPHAPLHRFPTNPKTARFAPVPAVPSVGCGIVSFRLAEPRLRHCQPLAGGAEPGHMRGQDQKRFTHYGGRP